jgi:hypothetical protein
MKEVVKFGYILFNNLYLQLSEDKLTTHFNSKDNIIFSTALPKIDDSTWEKWLGLTWKDIVDCNATIRIEMPTETPDVVNDENNGLRRKCDVVWSAMKLCSPFGLDRAYFLGGSRVEKEIRIRTYEPYGKWYGLPEEVRPPITDQNIERWKQIYKQLSFVYSELKQGKYFRFNRGLLWFLKSCEEYYIDFRLPSVVRSIEALILPDKGETTRQFKSRVCKWWPKNTEDDLFKEKATDVLQEIYEIRCDLDHLHGLEKWNVSKKALLRSRQCEKLARIAYQDILLAQDKLTYLENDEKIKLFWRK